MKKFNQIFIVAACMLLGILSSCSYLDVVPDEKATEKDAFEDKDAAKRFVYSCYAYILIEVVQVHWTSLLPMK